MQNEFCVVIKVFFEHNMVVMWVTLLEVSGKAEWSRIDLTTPYTSQISRVTLDSAAFVTPYYRPTKAVQAFLLSCFS